MAEVVHDKSDLSDAMEEVRVYEAQLLAVMQGVSDGIVMTDIKGRIELCNQSMGRMFGYESSELIEKHITELMPELERGKYSEFIRQFLLAGASAQEAGRHSREFSVSRKDGTTFRVMINIGVSAEDDKKRFVLVVHDLTENNLLLRKFVVAREKYLHREKMAAVGQLTAGIIHDIGNPVAAISGSVELLLRQLSKPLESKAAEDNHQLADAVTALGAIQDHVTRLLTVIRETSGLSAVRNDSMELLDINNLINYVAYYMNYDARFSRIEIVLAPGAEVPAIYASSDQLTQVIMNLMINAADAFSGIERNQFRITVSTGIDKGFLMLTVEDNGAGMDENTLNHLFDDIYTIKGSGHGIGLPLCQLIIKDHGGELSVKSEENMGTTITIRLPANSNRELS